MSTLNSQWAAQRERSNPLALRAMVFIARKLGRTAGRALLYPIVGYFLVVLRRVVGYSRDYLGRVFGRPAGLLDAARHMHCFASTLLDRVYLLTGRFEIFDIRIEGSEPLLRYARQGQGCLLLGSHLGSFEALRCLARTQPEIRVKALMRREQNPMMMQVVESLDPDFDSAVIDTSSREADVILEIQQALDAGYCVGMLGDRVYPGERSADCEFLGGQASFPTSPYLLAGMLKVPLVLFFALYGGANRYHVHFEELAQELHIPRQSREQELQAWAQRYAERLAYYARQAPYNWFNFYDFWKAPDAVAERP